MPDPITALRALLPAGKMEATDRWFRWRKRIEWSCHDDGFDGTCSECEFGPSCDESDHYPHVNELATGWAEAERENAQLKQAAIGVARHCGYPTLDDADGAAAFLVAAFGKPGVVTTEDLAWARESIAPREEPRPWREAPDDH